MGGGVIDWDSNYRGEGHFEGAPPWNIGEPQPELAALIADGRKVEARQRLDLGTHPLRPADDPDARSCSFHSPVASATSANCGAASEPRPASSTSARSPSAASAAPLPSLRASRSSAST